MKGPEDSKIDKFWKAEIRRLEEEFENDITPTVEKTRSAASTTGRTRSQRSAVISVKPGKSYQSPQGQTKGRTVSVPTVPGVSIVASPFNNKEFTVTPMTDLAHSGAGRGKHSRDLKRHGRTVSPCMKEHQTLLRLEVKLYQHQEGAYNAGTKK